MAGSEAAMKHHLAHGMMIVGAVGLILSLYLPTLKPEPPALPTLKSVVDSFVSEISMMETNYIELAGFTEHDKISRNSTNTYAIPLWVRFFKNVRKESFSLKGYQISVKDVGTNGLYLQFMVLTDDMAWKAGDFEYNYLFTNQNIYVYLNALYVLWSGAPRDLDAKLQSIYRRHIDMLIERDKEAGKRNKVHKKP